MRKKFLRGNILLFVLIFGTISVSIIAVGLTGYGISENRASVKKFNRELAFQVADAGVNYYRWHLAHAPADYWDGNASTTPGPYVHDYKNKDGAVIGQYSLQIATPTLGASVVTIVSTGWLNEQPNSKVKIKARVGFPSLTDYAFLTNTDVWIGDTEVTHGKFHANGGIRFDGLADAPVTSAVATYTCKSFHGCGAGQVKDGIWGQGGPKSLWSYPMPAKDFTAITAKLAEIYTNSDPAKGGIRFSSSGQQGWLLRFSSSTTPGQLTAYKVTATDCYKAKDVGGSSYFWPCIDIKTLGTGTAYDMPANGYIFVDDTVWVDGGVNGRAVIGTGVGKSIILNGNILYKAKNGEHVLGLMAEQNVLIPHNSPNYLEVDAAMLAQNGATKRYYYPGDMKESLYIFGSIITNKLWTWSWVSGGGAVVSGYRNTNSTYDENLTFAPPPGFPVGSEYRLLSWEEIK
ncbi:hypothetical protein EPN28_01480 [Patescibacteria group bacterium]|nr:MAG: hypothetical protein EPN28_01480 [Patescibacteria group bacterium]